MPIFDSPRFLDRRTPPHILTLVLMAGLATLSMGVFLPSLPGMAEYFGTDYAVLQLSVAVYLGVNAVLQLIVGPISDNIGRRPVVLWGMVLFILATFGCIAAPSAEVFLAFRMCQAAIVTSMVLSRAIVRDIVDDPQQAASMIAYVSMGMSLVPMVGPIIGGYLDKFFGWQASFWLLIGLGFLIIALVWLDLGETKRASGQTLRAQFGEYPELLKSPRFWGFALASGFTSGAFFAFLGGAPIVGTVYFGLEPHEVGLYFGAPAMGYFFGNFISGRYSARKGINWMVLTGASIAFVAMLFSFALFALGLGSELAFFGPIVLVGLGNGMTIPNATSGMLSVRPHLAGTASGLGGAFMIGIGAASSAAAGLMLGDASSIFPILWLLCLTTGLGVLAALLVIFRTRALQA